jgi:hypothetical protein
LVGPSGKKLPKFHAAAGFHREKSQDPRGGSPKKSDSSAQKSQLTFIFICRGQEEPVVAGISADGGPGHENIGAEKIEGQPGELPTLTPQFRAVMHVGKHIFSRYFFT